MEACKPLVLGRSEGPGVLVSADRGRTWDERGGAELRAPRHTHLIEGSVARAAGAHARPLLSST